MKKILFLFLLVLFIIVPVFSDEKENKGTDDYTGNRPYIKGDQFFSINAGAIFPLFIALPNSNSEDSVKSLDPLKIGIAGGFKWGLFLLNNFSIGAEIYGYYAQTANRNLLMFPISFTTSYYFKVHQFEFPVYMGLGISLNSLEDYFRVTPIIKPGAGAYWTINDKWSIGLNAEYWFIPEIVFGDYKDQTSLANFCQINLSCIYHF